MSHRKVASWQLCVLLFTAATPSFADEGMPAGAPVEAKKEKPVGHALQSSIPVVLADDDLGQSRALGTIVINDQDIDGVISGNSLGDYSAGAIAINDNALSNFNGVGNFMFNTGAQNNLQAGMTLTISIED